MTLTSTPLRQRVPMMDAAVLEDRTRPAPDPGRIASGLRDDPPTLSVRPKAGPDPRLGWGGQLGR